MNTTKSADIVIASLSVVYPAECVLFQMVGKAIDDLVETGREEEPWLRQRRH